ncbi:MAG: peptidylprolyl isomerase [Candidatus Gracilibacteria bacterium]|nr:peptidylprolyl isomerase [Candidatus Gracilibacteria bacterium]
MFKKICSFTVLALLLFSLSACGGNSNNDSQSSTKYSELVSSLTLQYEGDPLAMIETSKGTLIIELFQEQVSETVNNFIKLAEADFYSNLKWHIVLPGIKIQTGDPTGTGTGGSNTTPIKLETHPDLRHDKVGVVGMARYENDLNSATSQFYITLDVEPEWDRKYAIFGQVVGGAELLGAIERNDTVRKISIVKAE